MTSLGVLANCPRKSWGGRYRSDMRTSPWLLAALFIMGAVGHVAAQVPWSWEQVRDRFRENNPSLLAGSLNVQEAHADETTANLIPNPQLNVILDQFRV